MVKYERFEDFYVVDTTPFNLNGIISSFILIDDKITLIEPGPANEYKKLNDALHELNLRPDIIIATHVHLDHAGSTGFLLRDYPNSIAYIHPKGVKHIVDPSQLWDAAIKFSKLLTESYGKPIPSDPNRVIPADDGQEIIVGKHRIKFVHTPGHASHHMSIIVYPEKILFSGDSAGAIFTISKKKIYVITSPAPFKPITYLESIEKMKKYSPVYIAPTHYGIHEEAMKYLNLGIERANLWLNTVKESLRENKDIDQIYKDIYNKDEDFKYAVDANIQFLTNGFLMQSIDGIILAIKNGDWV
ncbi:MAG: MBL fold metallo-hydrolase [Caldisphaera sp.]|jgi:glyoxylase-like metal-dependent hydrolase (beta-lactamase superfamily II)|nr:MAG: hypothetical protein C0201_04180 [Caldisphaera sp.]PMP92095.1 MAG: hypothetical protein C0171_01600 [Caldisphaera sp.]